MEPTDRFVLIAGGVVLTLSERQVDVLVRVVDCFNQTGQPVGSSTVAEQAGIEVSSATIRNVMAELEEAGVLCQPHPSAGRMPTCRGMRAYVDYLVETDQLVSGGDVDWQRHMEGLGDGDLESTVRAAGSVISRLSQLTSIVSSPEVTQAKLKDLHLSKLGDDRVLVILITQDGRVFNRSVRLDEPVEPASLQRMQNYLSDQVVGLSLQQVRREVQRQLEAAEVQYRKFMRRALELGQQVVEMATRSELFVEGTIHILEVSELARDLERARDVMRTLEDRERILEVLDGVCTTPNARTLIGSELGAEWGQELSLVACGYFQDGRQVGLLGILGPMRMNYARLIPLVEQVAGVLSSELEELA